MLQTLWPCDSSPGEGSISAQQLRIEIYDLAKRPWCFPQAGEHLRVLAGCSTPGAFPGGTSSAATPAARPPLRSWLRVRVLSFCFPQKKNFRRTEKFKPPYLYQVIDLTEVLQGIPIPSPWWETWLIWELLLHGFLLWEGFCYAVGEENSKRG